MSIRTCDNCGDTLPESKRNDFRFCRQKCSKAWHARARYRRQSESIKIKESARRKRKYQCPIARMLKNAKNRSSVKGLTFSISKKDILIPDICPVLGIPLVIGSGQVTDNSPTLDRIIPALGYIPSNIRVISHRANRLKCDASVDEMRLILLDLEKIYGH